MKRREPAAEVGDRGSRHAVCRETPVEARIVRELAHLDGVLERRLRGRFAGGRLAADRHDAEIELGREPPIELAALRRRSAAALRVLKSTNGSLTGFLTL